MAMGVVEVDTAEIVGVEAMETEGTVVTEEIVAITIVERPDPTHMADTTLQRQQRLASAL